MQNAVNHKPQLTLQSSQHLNAPRSANLSAIQLQRNNHHHQQQQQQATTTTTTQLPDYLETSRQITQILDRFMSLGYDKRVRPNYGGPPVEVNVTMRILSISSVSEVLMDFTADFYFRQTWNDPRLAFKKLKDIQTLYVGAEVSKKIWLPDTFFGNEKVAYFHEATTPNVFLRIENTGEVFRSIRLTVTSSCPMNLQYFPMDKQRCTIEAESYGYSIKDIIYKWARKETAVERDDTISLPQFDIVNTKQKYRVEMLSSGTYSRLIAELHFSRRMGYYLIQIYIPSSLIVVISWVSFWLHRNASPARVQLGVTTVLTMTTLMSSTNAALPKISYVKSIDIFLGTCFLMVFAALLEYATVGYLGKRIAMRKAQAQHARAQAQARAIAHLQAQQQQLAEKEDQQDDVPCSSFAPHTDDNNARHAHHQTMTTNNNNNRKQENLALELQVPPPALFRDKSSYGKKKTKVRDEIPTTPIPPPRVQSHNPPPPFSFPSTNIHTHKSTHQPINELQYQQICLQQQQQQQPSEGARQKVTAAAATLLNLSRKNKGLPPSTNPNLSMPAPANSSLWLPGICSYNESLLSSINNGDKLNDKLNSIFGIRPSDIDKYSRVVFPVCFACFQLMYWIVYLRISAFLQTETGADQQQQAASGDQPTR